MSDLTNIRYNTLYKNLTNFLSKEPFQNQVTINTTNLKKAVDDYYTYLPKVKQIYQIKDKIDRHKVGAYTTLVINQNSVVKVLDNTNTNNNSFIKLALPLASIHCGLSCLKINIDDIDIKSLGSLIQQLQNKEDISILALSLIYYHIEKDSNKNPYLNQPN